MEVTPVSEYWERILRSGETTYAGLIYRIPPRLWRSLGIVQKELKSTDPRQLYLNAGNFHIPVKGLGYLGEEIDRDRYERTLSEIETIISGFSSFEINICGIGVFPTGIYAKVEDAGKFKAINEKISNELKGDVDISFYDSRSYVPHVTLASFLSKDVTKLLERANSENFMDFEFGPAGVFEIEVVRTNLLLALGPEETQDRAYDHMRSFWLSKFSH